MADLDLTQRDPNGINAHLKCAFEDVLAEPDDLHSIDCVWKLTHSCFTFWRNCCYRLVTFLFGCCIAIELGCEFAGLMFQHIWCITPGLRICALNCSPWQKCWGICCSCCLGPITEACGMLFSNIKAEFEDVLGEPEGIRSIDCVWKLSFTCFNCWRDCCYKVSTLFCGICIAAHWGCEFARLAIDHVWCCTPFMRVLSIECVTIRKCWSLCIDCCLGPLCEAFGLCLSKIKISKN